MSPSEPRRLARHVQPELTEARLARQWGDISSRLPERNGSRAFVPALCGAVAIAMAVVVVVRMRTQPLASLDGTVLENGGMTLSDGSRVTLREASRVRFGAVRADGVEITLERGAVELDVKHRESRRLVVRAGRFDVVDVGTHFRVQLAENGRCDVHVSEGGVEIDTRDGSSPPRRLAAGDDWSSAPDGRTTEAQTQGGAAPTNPETPPAPESTSTPTPTSTSIGKPTAKDLLDTAERAKLHGRPRDAAAALDALRLRYRNDPRAGLAAFELGRIRLDSLGDATGAVEALDDAIRLAPNAPFREDAEARRVEALDVVGSPACKEARDAYLARFANGLHATMVASRCGGH